MSWIKVISYDEAKAGLKKVYDRIKGPNNYIDNVFLAQSLRPRTLTGHMALYKHTIHNPNNTLPKWYLEAIGIYVSHLNGCDYCMTHHFQGFKRLYPNAEKANEYLTAIRTQSQDSFFGDKYDMGFGYARRLTQDPRTMQADHVRLLQDGGFTDGEILELNQVVGYFNYGNRTSLGLGVTLQGDIIGTTPQTLEKE